MQMPVEIRARGLTLTEDESARIRERAAKLERFYDRIVRVRVTVEGPGRHHRTGDHRVRMDVTVPGAEIVINRQSGKTVEEALREAFEAAGRRIEDHVRVSRGLVKQHLGIPLARVVKVFPERGTGVLEDASGRRIVFREPSVQNAPFGHLAPGMEVHFTEEEGEEGPEATTVVVVGR
ncbi:MAG TPA: HPF/RaiA family ribosome-associated protein [Planctomycetota bacterium]|nr:HPF/RaiA family ribosome-associated protein [Planctomycetota bacterium]